jgi:hypothetical protein
MRSVLCHHLTISINTETVWHGGTMVVFLSDWTSNLRRHELDASSRQLLPPSKLENNLSKLFTHMCLSHHRKPFNFYHAVLAGGWVLTCSYGDVELDSIQYRAAGCGSAAVGSYDSPGVTSKSRSTFSFSLLHVVRLLCKAVLVTVIIQLTVIVTGMAK